MTREEAKFILQAYDPSREPAEDERLAEALEMLVGDPELRAWHEQEVVGDMAVRSSLEAVKPPADLAGTIVNGMQAIAATRETASTPVEAPAPQRKILSFPGVWLAAAAAVVLLAGVLVYNTQPGPREFHSTNAIAMADAAGAPELIAQLVEHSNSIRGLEVWDEDVTNLRSFLASNNYPAPTEMRGQFADKTGLGCLRVTLKKVSIGGQTIDQLDAGLICLRANNQTYHYYTVAFSEKLQGIVQDDVEFFTFGGKTAAAWLAEDKLHIVALEGQESDLRPLL